MAEEKVIERQTAKIVSLKELNSGKYVKQEGWDPNYILTLKDEKVSRCNTLGVVVTVPDSGNSVFIDDGTGKIEIRTFDNQGMFKDITIGDIVLVIGRPREYENTLYINAEIVKKIDNKGWLEFRKKEITLRNILHPDKEAPKEELPEGIVQEEEVTPPEEIDEVEEVILKIKELDQGSGCDVSELVGFLPKAESIVEQLLLKGDVFEISPGKIKILE